MTQVFETEFQQFHNHVGEHSEDWRVVIRANFIMKGSTGMTLVANGAILIKAEYLFVRNRSSGNNNGNRCVKIKQNESEVGSEMLLVSDSFYTLHIMPIEFETRHLRTLQYQDLHNMFIRYM